MIIIKNFYFKRKGQIKFPYELFNILRSKSKYKLKISSNLKHIKKLPLAIK